MPKIVEEGWTARKVERYFQDHKKKSSTALIKRDQHHKDEDALSAKYNAVVRISGKSLTFKCKTISELQNLIDSFK